MQPTLSDFIRGRADSSDFRWACTNYESLVHSWVDEAQPRCYMEIGGGRNPLLTTADVRRRPGLRYIVNDISSAELARLDPAHEAACFDIQSKSTVPVAAGSCDLLTAKMVFEHLSDPERAYRNVFYLLEPGGSFLSLMPTMFAPPFVINRLLPEGIGRPLLRRFNPSRNDDETPKFPAFYRWCRASTNYLRQRLEPIGFSSVDVMPFYGHDYFRRFPLVRTLDDRLSAYAAARDRTVLASYAYVVLRR